MEGEGEVIESEPIPDMEGSLGQGREKLRDSSSATVLATAPQRAVRPGTVQMNMNWVVVSEQIFVGRRWWTVGCSGNAEELEVDLA